MNYTELEAHLAKTEIDGKRLFKRVLTAVDQQEVLNKGIVREDAAFLVPMQENGDGEFLYDGDGAQAITCTFGVIVSVRAINDRIGRNVNERLQRIYRAVRQHMIGYQPESTATEIMFVSGETILFGNGGAFWLETFTTNYTETQRSE